jgi:hypothetical protein
VYYDDSRDVYVKVWDEDYVRASNLKLIETQDFFGTMIPHFRGLIKKDSIIRGYVMKAAIPAPQHYDFLLNELKYRTKHTNIFLNDFCEQHCYEFEGNPCLIDLEGIWLLDEYQKIVEHCNAVEKPKGNFIVDLNYKKFVDALYKYVPISLLYFLQCELHKGKGGKEIPLLDYKLDTVNDVVNYWNDKTIAETLPKLKPHNWQYFNCMLSEFRHNVEDHHDRKNENMTLEYYTSLQPMDDISIMDYLSTVPCEFHDGFIKHSVHRAYAMIGRLINNKCYIPFYMDRNEVFSKKINLPIHNLNHLLSILELPAEEFTIVQSGILALMGVRGNDDLDIVISSKLKKTLDARLKGVEIMADHKKFRVFGCKDDDDLIYNYSQYISGIKFAQPRFYFSRKNKTSLRDQADWEYMQSFFYHHSHLTYPYRIFSKKEWGYDFVM